MDTINESPAQDIPQRTKSILVHHGSVDTDDESFFRTPMRPRANTDPISPRPCYHVRFDLPDIVVDDCSDNDEENVDRSRPEEINKELANTEEGAFFVFKSPPRQRSNTCPVNMFSKHKERRNRPPTPPPAEKLPEDTFPRYPSWEKVQFSPHSLTSVEEAREFVVTQEKSVTKSESPTRSRKTVHTRTVKSSSMKEFKSSSPKRSVPRLPNGHVGAKSNTIHTTA
ncbi:uncharacterized protein LOC132715298 [Ruditapes philippinarum]|uniref:uncharacterized protein LOC132715298 n=1 Tax=Ruditapes philippinarum TaxID=129788 RepID=UPI00295C2E4D|nr:uncharacterized protein LOC132715298 [Ruditapes philippinarum]